jgi:hypothetical protein
MRKSRNRVSGNMELKAIIGSKVFSEILEAQAASEDRLGADYDEGARV